MKIGITTLPLSRSRTTNWRRSGPRAPGVGDVPGPRVMPFFATPKAVNRNVLAYLPARFSVGSIDESAHASPPFWLVATVPETDAFHAARPLLSVTRRLELAKPETQLVLIEK